MHFQKIITVCNLTCIQCMTKEFKFLYYLSVFIKKLIEWRFFCWDIIFQKNILQHPQFVESLAELSEPIQTPSSVMTFAVICGLILMRLQNLQNYNIKCKVCEAHYIGVKQQGNWALGKTKTGNQCKPAISSLLCLNMLRMQATP